MARRHILTLVAMVLTATASGQQDNSTTEARAEREIRQLEDRLDEAVVKGDLEFFDRTFADDFTHTNHLGVFRTKAQWMANHRDEDAKAVKSPYDSFRSEDLAVRICGPTAVVTGRSIPTGRDAKGQPIRGEYRFLRVWARREGRWQVVAFQSTRITGS